MSIITLPAQYIVDEILCIPPVDDFPLTASKNCYINLQGHITEPDGLYIYNGTDWVLWFVD